MALYVVTTKIVLTTTPLTKCLIILQTRKGIHILCYMSESKVITYQNEGKLICYVNYQWHTITCLQIYTAKIIQST